MKNKLIFKNININNNIYLLLLIMVIGGIFGFLYETIFYYFDLGYIVKRGTTFGPWIPIYAFGSLFIVLFTYKYRNNYVKVFILNCIITGLLEFLTGFILHQYFNIRLWNYNNEILNLGNINGYICLRSVLFFGISSLLLIYIIIPYLLKITSRVKEKYLRFISIFLFSLFILDIILYRILIN